MASLNIDPAKSSEYIGILKTYNKVIENIATTNKKKKDSLLMFSERFACLIMSISVIGIFKKNLSYNYRYRTKIWIGTPIYVVVFRVTI